MLEQFLVWEFIFDSFRNKEHSYEVRRMEILLSCLRRQNIFSVIHKNGLSYHWDLVMYVQLKQLVTQTLILRVIKHEILCSKFSPQIFGNFFVQLL